MNIAQKFGKSNLFAILTIFFAGVTIPIIGLDDSEYNSGKADASQA